MVRYPHGPRGAGAEGFGDWRGDIAASIAGNEIDKLVSGIFKVQDSLINSINARNGIFDGYQQAKLIYSEAVKTFGDKAMTRLEPAISALTGATMAVKVFARQIQTLSELWVVFAEISSKLHAAGLYNDENAVNQTVNQVRRFVTESDAKFAGIPQYNGTKQEIIAAFVAELRMWGVDRNAYGDPRWFGAFIKAADKVVELPGRPTAPGEIASFGVSGLGGLGNPLPMLIVALLWVLAIVAATVTLMYGINKTINALNSEAVTARDLILQRDKEKEQLRMELVRQGKGQAEINAAMAQFDRETRDQVKDIPKSGLLSSLLLPLGIAAGGLVAVFVIPEIVRKL
jgi:hypothetical protein